MKLEEGALTGNEPELRLTNHIENIVKDAEVKCARIKAGCRGSIQCDEWSYDYHREVKPPNLFVPVGPCNGRQLLGVAKKFVHVVIRLRNAGSDDVEIR